VGNVWWYGVDVTRAETVGPKRRPGGAKGGVVLWRAAKDYPF